MVAQLTIHFLFVGRRDECSVGSGLCKDIRILQKLVMWMMANKLNDNEVAGASPVCTWACTSSKHVFIKQQKNERKLNP
jgi:hypothetical protein